MPADLARAAEQHVDKELVRLLLRFHSDLASVGADKMTVRPCPDFFPLECVFRVGVGSGRGSRKQCSADERVMS
eukprot:442566-Rhodomonas_salina.6